MSIKITHCDGRNFVPQIVQYSFIKLPKCFMILDTRPFNVRHICYVDLQQTYDNTKKKVAIGADKLPKRDCLF